MSRNHIHDINWSWNFTKKLLWAILVLSIIVTSSVVLSQLNQNKLRSLTNIKDLQLPRVESRQWPLDGISNYISNSTRLHPLTNVSETSEQLASIPKKRPDITVVGKPANINTNKLSSLTNIKDLQLPRDESMQRPLDGISNYISSSTRLHPLTNVSETSEQLATFPKKSPDRSFARKPANIQTVSPVSNGSSSIPSGLTPIKTNSEARITIVTAYFDLGTFKKGSGNFTTNTYRQWARTFAYLVNPLVVYTDSHDFEGLMRDIRQNWTENTKFIKINRNSSWAFQNNDIISRIYSDKSYPKHHPNTVVSEYTCAQHAKYDVTARAARDNYFHTEYFAWLDVGYFRHKESVQTSFKLELPPRFNTSLLSMNFISDYPMSKTPSDIFKRNLVLIGGGLFLGTQDVIVHAEQQFKRAVDYFLSQNLSNTDQQVVFAMFSDEGSKQVKPEIGLQCYKSSHRHDWFYLGYLMRKEIKVRDILL